MVHFANYTLFLVLTLPTEIYLSTQNYEYVALSLSVRDLLPLKILIKEVVEKLVMNSDNMEFVSISTVYGNNSGYLVVEKSQR